jgi:hypothetical protein
MPRPSLDEFAVSAPLPLEPDPDLVVQSVGRYQHRRVLKRVHGQYYGDISHRTLEAWPLAWRRVNGRAVCDVREFLAEAQRRFDAAPVVMGGRRATRDTDLIQDQHAA